MYYLSRLYSSQVKDGEKYTQLRKTIGISIIDFDLLAAETRIHNCYKLLNTVSKNELTDLFELNFVELTKFKLDKPRALQTKFEKWLHVIKFGDALYGDGRALPEELINEEGITMAFEELNKVNADPVMRDILEARAKAMSTIATIKEDGYIQGMTKGIIDGKVLGRTEGREEGRAEGKAEGKVEGKAEGKTEGELQGKIDSVKTLVKVKFGDIKSEEISKLQKMNIEQIEAVLTKIFSYANYDEFKNEIAIK
jgi:predicted transposase/invertase (TIGR01784 family)